MKLQFSGHFFCGKNEMLAVFVCKALHRCGFQIAVKLMGSHCGKVLIKTSL